MFYNREFLDELFLNRDRELFIKINLLTWNELKIKEIQGLVSTGSLSVDGNSPIRRTINVTLVLDPDTYLLPEVANEITISKKISILIGLKNNTYYGMFPDLTTEETRILSEPIIWFNLGVFVPTDVSLSHSIEDSSVSVSAQDKMVLLNGDIAGELGYDIDFVNTITNENLPYQTIIKDSVSYFGGIDESKVVVLDVPYYAESLTRVPLEDFTFYGDGQSSDPQNGIYYVGTQAASSASIEIGKTVVQIFTNQFGEGLLSADSTVSVVLDNGIQLSKPILGSGNFTFYISPAVTLYSTPVNSYGQRTFNISTAAPITSGTALSPPIDPGAILPLQVVLSPKNKDTKIEVSSTDTVNTILERVKSDLLGEYEYFFDIDGNFIFQFKKNLESNLSNISLFQNDGGNKYLANFDFIPYIYNFSDKEIVSSYSNAPNWKGVKNDFYVYGANNLLYHLVIDTIPEVPSQFYVQDSGGTWTSTLGDYNQPWQQYIIDLTEYNAQTDASIEESRYYAELKKYFEYNSEDNTGIYKKTSATAGVWRSQNTGEEDTDFDTNKPLGDAFTWNYFFDIISDSNSSVSQFSVNAIGRRIKSIRDDNITIIYPRTLEPTYTDSAGRSVKVILYEDLETVPVSFSSFTVPTNGRTVSATFTSPTTVNVGDILTISGIPPFFNTKLNGSWSIYTASSTTIGFTTSDIVTASTYYVNLDRATSKLIANGVTTLTMLTSSIDIRKGMTVTGTGIQASTTVTNVVQTSADVNAATLTSLSTARYELAGTSVGNYALFGGGYTTTFVSTVNAYDTSFIRTTPTALSAARHLLAGTSVGNYGLFGGGFGGGGSLGTTVDAYDTSLTRTSPTQFANGVWDLAATSVGSYALFGGGRGYPPGAVAVARDYVYAYNTSLTQSTPTVLSAARLYLAASSNANYALFGGGSGLSTVDAYNTSLTRSTPTALSLARQQLAAASVNNYVLFGGGTDGTARATVDAYDSSLTRTTPTTLSTARYNLAASQISSIALFGGGYTGAADSSVVDYYDTSLSRTVATALSAARQLLAAAVVADSVLFGGGTGPSAVVNRYYGGTQALSVTISKATLTSIPNNTTLFFSVGDTSIAEYTAYIETNADALKIESEFESLEVPYVSILKSQIENYLDNQEFQYKSDAFSTMKNLLYIHTNFNESISVSSIPIYSLEPNKKIHITDLNTGISGNHYLQSFTVPLSHEGTMEMSAVKIYAHD